MTKIYFNNSDIFSGISPTPLVQLSEQPIRYGNYWGTSEVITLIGQITGKCDTFASLLNKQNTLISSLGAHFSKLEINEDGNSIYSWPFTKVKSINFESAQYSQLLGYSIDFECYDSGKFSGVYGVIEPRNQIAFSEAENGFITVTHSCSAVGIPTTTGGSNALTNAKNYVSTISGWNNISGFSPLFVSGAISQPILVNVSENINRLNNTYSIEETWSYDPSASGSGLFSYTTSINSGVADELLTVDLNGELNGGLRVGINNLRGQFDLINKYSLASGALSNFSSEALCTVPTSFNISENPNQNLISFSYVYDNSSSGNPVIIDEFTLNKSSRGPSSVSIKNIFKWKGNCLCNSESGWNALNSAASGYNYYEQAVNKWQGYGNSGTLSSWPTSTSVTKNKNNCEISVEKEFKEIILTLPSELEYIDVSLSVTPSIVQYEGTPVFQEGAWYITNLGYKNRAKYSFNGSARIKQCISQTLGIQVIKAYISNMVGIYVFGDNPVMEEGSITEEDSDNKLINFTFTYSAMASSFSI